ncbi:MAG: GFA family protein [Pseudomonadota bacterium]
MPIHGSCHCGAVQWQAPEPEVLTLCNCSYCDRTGGEWAYCSPAEFRLLTAAERVCAYQFGHYVGTHYYCANCGCATHGRFPGFVHDKPDYDHPRISYNVRMAHGFDRSALPVKRLDGASQ